MDGSGRTSPTQDDSVGPDRDYDSDLSLTGYGVEDPVRRKGQMGRRRVSDSEGPGWGEVMTHERSRPGTQ